ncbi:glycosyltransferase family 4 protein [Pelagibacterium montanilacus]|uniref:glycosyltransferase family 4 protein n=1 Tax=Pelagibacterium montanilacus TaxID=2185280 RepID=UPI000F8CA6F4|nr:glycosyltransferase family 4 protein [Pelagibacterium montanilacus]
MRILHVMRAPVGGLFRHVADLTEALASRGHDVGVVVDESTGNAATEGRLTALGAHATLGIHRLPIPRVLGLADAITPIRIARLARKLGVGIVHGHGAKGGFMARLAALSQEQVRVVYTPHGGVLHYDPRTASGWTFLQLEKALLGRTDALIFESHHARTAYAAKVADPSTRGTVIHNGLRPGEFEPVTLDADGTDFVFIGELRMLKGLDLLLGALAPLVRPDGRPATLTVAGDGPDADRLRAMTEELGLAERVRFVGVQPARAVFAMGHCVVVPSRAESLPYVVMEAAAAGRPVVATDVGGIPEIFGPTRDTLVPPDDRDALGAALNEALARQHAQRARTEARLDHVRNAFTLDRMAGGIEAVYTRVIASA